MTQLPTLRFAALTLPKKGTLVVLTRPETALSGLLHEVDLLTQGQVSKAIAAQDFKSAARSTLTILAPSGTDLDSLVLVGLGDKADITDLDLNKLGGAIKGAVPKSAKAVAIALQDPQVLSNPEEGPDGEADEGTENAPSLNPLSAAAVAEIALGVYLRSYKFDLYKTKKDEPDDTKSGDKEAGAKKAKKKKAADEKPAVFTLLSADPKAAKKVWSSAEAIAAGVCVARDLVNEPGNILGPVEFADRTKALADLGVDVEILDEKQLSKIGMRALLGVAQGSRRPARVAIMRWKGGKTKEAPVALVGKGVIFDTGGISLKPAGGMEDMKGDMGGAAAVVGAMHALAGRKAKCNVIGIIGCVENMPDGNAQRPGDIVTSLSGQTIEVINTDAEGRLVLCDVMTYIQREEKPKVMIDLATLTGAMVVALGHHKAGIFSNDDDLAAGLLSAGEATGDATWRMPLGPEYDKQIDSRFADMKNVGGRWGGAITAAQFLARFVEGDTKWAHIDLAGTAMNSPDSDFSKSWGSGYGVRLLDRLVADLCEG